MSFTSFMSSILPTIGTVVGALLGANSVEDGVLYYAFRNPNSDSEQVGGAVFSCTDGEYTLYNPSVDPEDAISISFLGRSGGPQCSSESYVIPGFHSMGVNALFQTYADNDNSKFELASSVANPTAVTGADNNSYVQMAVSQKGITAEETPDTTKLGSYLTVALGVEQIAITGTGSMALSSVSNLEIKGSGDTAYRFSNMDAVDGVVTIDMPEPLLSGDACEVEISGVLSCVSTLSINHNNSIIKKMDEGYHAAIMAAPRLNWQKNNRQLGGK